MNEDSSQLQTRTISVIDPLSQAMVWSRDVLFRPFDLGKWIVLGFCAWLAGLGERGGGGNGSFNIHDGGSRRDFERGMHEAWEWLLANLALVLFVVAVAFVIIFTVWLLFLWLSSRGKFMFLDGVVHNRAAVVAPWRQFRAPGNALFRFRFVVGLIGGVIVLAFLASLVFLAWLSIDTDAEKPLLILFLI